MFWDLDSGTVLASLTDSDWVRAIAVTPDGRRVVSASDDKTLRIWDVDSGASLATLKRSLTFFAVGLRLATLEGHSYSVCAVALTPDGHRAISASHDRTLKIWDIHSGALLATFEGHTNLVFSVAVTPDGRRAISGSFDNSLKVWDLESHRELACFQCDSSVYAVATAGNDLSSRARATVRSTFWNLWNRKNEVPHS